MKVQDVLSQSGQNWVGVANLFEHTRVVSNTLTNSNQFYDNADITQNFTMRKDWDFVFASAAFGGKYKITG